MTKPTLRNPYKSNLLNYITVIETLEKIKEKDLEIITFSSQMKLVLSKYFSKKFNLKIYVNKNNNDFLNNISSLVKTFVFQFFFFLYIKIFIKKKNYYKNSKLTFIDTFVTLNKKLNEGFYPIISNKINKTVVFVPTIVQTLRFYKLIKLIREIDKSNYLFKEHF